MTTALPDGGFERLLAHETRDRARPWLRAAWIAMALLAAATFLFALLGWRKPAFAIVGCAALAVWVAALALRRGGLPSRIDPSAPRPGWRSWFVLATALLFPAALYGVLELGVALGR